MNMICPIPQMGFGTWKRSGDEGEAEVLAALDAGYRHIDTAEWYDNEAEVGRALKASGLKRSDVFITTKVAPDNLGPGRVMPHAKASLEKLQLDQVDLLLVHWPSTGDRYDVHDYMAQFAAVKQAGLTKHIGVSNFTKRHLAAAISVVGKDAIATNQVEVHPFFQNTIMRDHCKALGIPLTAYAPLARGAVSNSPVLQRIAKQHGATEAQIALAFLMAEGHIVIPTSTKPQRMRENLKALDITLSSDDIMFIRAMDENRRMVSGSWAPTWDV